MFTFPESEKMNLSNKFSDSQVSIRYFVEIQK